MALGQKVWYLVKKEEGAAGSVLGGGSFLRREGVPVLGERTKKESYWSVRRLEESVCSWCLFNASGRSLHLRQGTGVKS